MPIARAFKKIFSFIDSTNRGDNNPPNDAMLKERKTSPITPCSAKVAKKTELACSANGMVMKER